MKYLAVLLLFLCCCTAYGQSSKIMDCTVETASGTSDLYVFLTDTVLVTGFNVKLGTQQDGADVYSQQYSKATLPASASLDYNTLYLPLGPLGVTGEVYVWVRVLLSTGGYYEIKVTSVI